MEKLCEFCRVLRPLVYCEADGAQLCLCCDAKVHSANALSQRHRRSLLCDSCRFRPASFHCSSDHNIYTCCSCDKALHTTLAQHQRHPIHSYTGCPSVNEFSALWDFDFLNHVSAATAHLHPTTSFLVQQIMDLKKLNDDEDGSNEEDTYSSPFKLDRKLVNDLNRDPFPATPFTLESLQSSSSVVVEGDSFWQCRVQTNPNQFSAQNMQDLGVCEDLSRNDFNIPDVDVTFQNYEQLFGGDNNNMPSIIRGVEEEDAAYYNNNMSSATSDHISGQFVDNIIAGSCSFPPYSISQDHHFHDEVDLEQASSKEDATKINKDKKKALLHEKKTPYASALTSASASPSVENADVRKRVIDGEVRMQRFRYH